MTMIWDVFIPLNFSRPIFRQGNEYWSSFRQPNNCRARRNTRTLKYALSLFSVCHCSIRYWSTLATNDQRGLLVSNWRTCQQLIVPASANIYNSGSGTIRSNNETNSFYLSFGISFLDFLVGFAANKKG